MVDVDTRIISQWTERIKELEQQNATFLSVCKAAYKDYQKVFDGRGMPSVMVMNKLESVIDQVESND